MAEVRSTGAIVTVVHVEAMDVPDDAPAVNDGTVVSFAVRLYAKLDVGTLAIAAAPGLGVAIPTEALSLARLRRLLPDGLDAFPEQRRREMWRVVADEVERLDAISSPDELMR